MSGGRPVTRREILRYLASAAVGAGIGAGITYVGSPPRVVEVPVVPPPKKAPESIKIGIVTFLSGPAALLGVEGARAAEWAIEKINAEGGIAGVKIKHIIIDESGGAEANVAILRRLHEEEKVDVAIGWISSADALAVAPVAEELGQLTIIYNAGTHRIFEERRYKFVFRTKSHVALDAVGAALAVLKTIPDLERVSMINQDYAWGRDNAEIFALALKKLKPDVEIVSEYFHKLYETDYTPFITRLAVDKPQVVFSSSWGGDLVTFIKQAAGFGLFKDMLFCFTNAGHVFPVLGREMPEGVLVGQRGPHWFEYPDPKTWPLQKEFNEGYYAKYGHYPVGHHDAYHMWQAIFAYKAAVEKAVAVTGEWPEVDDIIKAFENLTIPTPNGHIIIREDHDGVEPALFGFTVHTPKYPFATLKDLMVFSPEMVNPPVGVRTLDWINSW